MKATYQKPAIWPCETESNALICMSLNKYDTGSDKVILTNDECGWDIWGTNVPTLE